MVLQQFNYKRRRIPFISLKKQALMRIIKSRADWVKIPYYVKHMLKARFLFVIQRLRITLPFCAEQLFIQRFRRNKMKAVLVKVLNDAFGKHALFFVFESDTPDRPLCELDGFVFGR